MNTEQSVLDSLLDTTNAVTIEELEGTHYTLVLSNDEGSLYVVERTSDCEYFLFTRGHLLRVLPKELTHTLSRLPVSQFRNVAKIDGTPKCHWVSQSVLHRFCCCQFLFTSFFWHLTRTVFRLHSRFRRLPVQLSMRTTHHRCTGINPSVLTVLSESKRIIAQKCGR